MLTAYHYRTQVNDSGHRIPRDPAGKSPYPAEKHRKSLGHGSSIPAGNCPDFFRRIPANFLCFPAGIGRKALEKIRKFSGRNTASTKSPELPGTGRFRVGLFDLGGHNFEAKHLYFDNFFTSLGWLEKLKLQNIKASGTIRPDRAGISPDFAKKYKMERGDYKSIITSNSIVFIWMDTKHAFLARNYHKDNEIVSISRQLTNGQRITINYPKAIKDYNQFVHGVDRLSQRISCYNVDRKSKRNWLRIFIYFLNASIFNSFICYNQLPQDKLTYLNTWFQWRSLSAPAVNEYVVGDLLLK
jgi:hypothetical protein